MTELGGVLRVAGSPQQALERSELRQAVRDGLNTLSPEHRQVLVLREPLQARRNAS